MNGIRYKYNLECLDCHSDLVHDVRQLTCPSCGRNWPIVNEIPDFREKDEYWCNVSREKMIELNRLARETGDWLSCAKQIVPEYIGHFVSFSRADCQFLWPTAEDSKILDAGCMWGGLTIPAAQCHGEIYAVDKTIETLEFLKIRSMQMGLSNVHTFAASLQRLPFPSNFFDIVVLNGVLEWVGVEEDVILEEHWDGRWQNSYRSCCSPEELQLKCLKELLRVLKPGAVIFLAIENRFGIQYFIGHPDDHVNIRFITFFPRWLASYITKKKKNINYRTYIYSPIKLKNLIYKTGFHDVEILSVFPHYGQIDRLVSFRLLPALRSIMLNARPKGIRARLTKAVWSHIPRDVFKYFSPSLAAIARKPCGSDDYQLKPRLINILEKKGILDSGSNNNRYEPIIINSRFGNLNPCTYGVFDKSQGRVIYYCKIGRCREATEMLRNELEQMKIVRGIFNNSHLLVCLPEPVDFFEIDNIPVQVTKYMYGKPVMNGVSDTLKSIPYERFDKRPSIKTWVIILNRYALKRWLKKVDPIMIKALDLLVTLQVESTVEKVNGVEYLLSNAENQLKEIIKKGFLTKEIVSSVEKLKKKISLLENFDLPLCFQHGDYDLCNLLESDEKLFLVDFEHSENYKPPFFDLGNILFSTLLSDWKRNGGNLTLKDYADKYSWSQYIRKWVKYYSEISLIPIDVLKLLPAITVLEQNSKNYPNFRDPYTYPMYGITSLEALFHWKLFD